MEKKVKQFDYSDAEYIRWNDLNEESEPMRAVRCTVKGREQTHLVNVTTYPLHLLPGGKGAGKDEGEGKPASKPRKKGKGR